MLLYACDFADRMEKEILPALSAGFIVIADRYIYTAIARACVRGVDSQWLRRLYGFALAPHLVFYLKIDADTLVRRVLDNGGISYWESGMDMRFGDDIFDNFRAYQRRLLKTYTAMSKEFGFRVLDGRMPIDTIQEELRRQVGAFLDAKRDRQRWIRSSDHADNAHRALVLLCALVVLRPDAAPPTADELAELWVEPEPGRNLFDGVGGPRARAESAGDCSRWSR